MEAYENLTARNLALEYTSLQNEEKIEAAVLDLSCKKEQLQDNSCNLSPVSLEARSVSPSSESTNEQHHYPHHNNNNNNDKYHQHHHQEQGQKQQQQAQEDQNIRHHCYHDFHNHHSSEEDEQKSPESRSYMVTPPSDSDSPTKSRYQAIPPRQISPKADLVHHYPPHLSPMLSVNIPITHSVPHPEIPVPNNSIPYPEVLAPTNLLTMNPKVSEQVCAPDGGKKAPRPFKAYPKDPLTLTVGPPEFIYDPNSKEAYNEFRKRMLESVRKTNDGTNIKMRRLSKNSNLPTSTIDDKDMAYWERRRKNNEAAKRSRDARRAKEDEIAIRAAYLEQENIKLKYEILALRNETARLRCMVYPS